MKEKYKEVNAKKAWQMMEKQQIYAFMPYYMNIGGKRARICSVMETTIYYFYE